VGELRGLGVPNDVINQLRPLENVRFRNDRELLANIRSLVPADRLKPFEQSLIERGTRLSRRVQAEPMDLVTFAAFAFGSLLLIIAGAYLPQLTNIKLPGVQLEKSSAEQVESPRSVRITR